MRPAALLAAAAFVGIACACAAVDAEPSAATPAAVPTASSSASTTGLELGFVDDRHFSDPLTGGTWLARARAVNGQIVRIGVAWSAVAPQRPPAAAAATDPGWAGYRWAKLDAAVRAASVHGLRVLLSLGSAPDWAEGPHPPSKHRPGTWRPSPTALGAFATAAARRYGGSFADAAGTLPAVGDWQAWNEPNLDYYLAPQWRRHNGTFVPASPEWYRRMLNAVYAGVRSVQPHATIVSAGTAPYGDSPGATRMRPAQFTRELLCLRSSALRPLLCPDPAHFDALDHHPYSIAGPDRHALNADDVGIPDLARITGALRKAERTGRALPGGRKPLWITEVSWDSAPPDPHGVPLARHARWLQQALHSLWRQGARVILWLSIGDQPPVPSYAGSYQSGVFFGTGAPKPAATAFRFPFVLTCPGRACTAWGRSPTPGSQVTIERGTAAGWRALRSVIAGADGVFSTRVEPGGAAVLRARAGQDTSLAWARR